MEAVAAAGVPAGGAVGPVPFETAEARPTAERFFGLSVVGACVDGERFMPTAPGAPACTWAFGLLPVRRLRATAPACFIPQLAHQRRFFESAIP